MSNLWFNIRLLNWFLQIGHDWPWIRLARHPDMEPNDFESKFAVYCAFGKHYQ